MAPRCPACDGSALVIVYEQDRVPVHSCLLLDDAAQARAFPTGTITLAFCEACGFITNTSFEPAMHRYSAQYEETQEFSPRFQQFARELATHWVERYDLRCEHVLEIGCGKGSFLAQLCEAGDNRGTGIDPSYVPGRLPDRLPISFVRELYDERFGPIVADAVVCRHTLEHIGPVAEFMRTVRDGIGDRTDTLVLFELPDTHRVLIEGAFWDVYYEHCSYFTVGSLVRLFRRTGFEVLDVTRVFDDQYLVLEALPDGVPGEATAVPGEDDLAAVRAAALGFDAAIETRVRDARRRIDDALAAERRVAVWGSGSKGVAFLTRLGLGAEVEYVVDINPYKRGRYMAGTGHRIVAPEDLRDAPPDLVIVMNPVYRDEIASAIAALGLEAELVTT